MRMAPLRLLGVAAWLMAVLAAGCGGGSTDGDTGPDGDGLVDGDLDETESEGSDLPDQPDRSDEVETDHPDCPGQWVSSVSLSVLDGDGTPLAGVAAALCLYGVEPWSVCLPPVRTDAAGDVAIGVPTDRRCVSYAAVRINSPDPERVVMPCPVHGSGDVQLAGPVYLPRIPEPARTIPSGQDQPHTVTAPDGSRLIVVPSRLLWFDEPFEELRLMTWDDTRWGWPCFVDPASPPSGLVAIVPELPALDPDAAHVVFSSGGGLPSGTSVAVFAVGGVGTEDFEANRLREGEWRQVGSGTVSPDGAAGTDPAHGLPFLTWAGWLAR